MKLRHLFFACSGVFVMMFSLLLLVVIVFSDEEDGGSGGNLIYGGVSVSQEVLAHKPMLEKYAREYGIEEYLNVLLAIIQVESGGTLEDVMQSSESLGLPPNSLSTEESIKQGCKYFSELLAAAETKGCDLNSVIQSYNYGGGFLDYVAGHGKKYTFELAESFARDKSGGKKVTYTNPVAVEKNGGWRYSYGNMFYVLLVSQYLTVAQFDDETVQAIMEEALKYEGWTYVYGGDSPSTSFDCSGLVQWCYGKAGIALPRTAQEQYNVTQHIPLSEAKAGDAKYQKAIRDAQVERAEKMLKSGKIKKERRNPNDPARFIGKTAVTENGEIAKIENYLDTDKIENEALYDGLYAVTTDLLDDDVKDILKVSEGRWEIEECFRIMKTDFEARPVYLQDETRIKAHFLICFLSLAIYRYLEKSFGSIYTCETILDKLKTMNFADVQEQGFMPLYTRDKLTDTLHSVCGFETDFQFITKSQMKTIQKKSKGRE